MAFTKATKKQAKLRLSLIGPSGSGKTYTALNIAQELGQRVALIDTERGSASKYAGDFSFDVMELDTFHPDKYIAAIHEAEQGGYDVLIIDSLSHAWMGKDGALELVDRAARRSQSANSFAAWRDVTPLHNALVDAMVQSRLHLIVTMRAKTEYVMETNEKGKQVPRKIGMAPIQRDGLEYEFDVVADMDLDNTLIVSKTRCKALKGAVIQLPGKSVADALKAWLTDGAPDEEPPRVPASKETLDEVRSLAAKLGMGRNAITELAASKGILAAAENWTEADAAAIRDALKAKASATPAPAKQTLPPISGPKAVQKPVEDPPVVDPDLSISADKQKRIAAIVEEHSWTVLEANAKVFSKYGAHQPSEIKNRDYEAVVADLLAKGLGTEEGTD